MAKNRICLTCGTEYEYCGSCSNSLNLPVWKNIFDTENCKVVFETVSDYAQNVITKEKARTRLVNSCSLNMKYKKSVQNYLNEILTEEKIENIPAMVEEQQVKTKNRRNKKQAVSSNGDGYMSEI